MGLKTYLRGAAATCLATLMIGQSGMAFAEPLGLRGAGDDEWRFTVSPYLFLQGASGLGGTKDSQGLIYYAYEIT